VAGRPGRDAVRAELPAADGEQCDPSSRALPWPSFGDRAQVLSLVPPQPQVETGFAAAHHCSFWAAG
jgi:hypothetical protein